MRLKKIIIYSLVFFLISSLVSLPAAAAVKFSNLLTTEGLNQAGFPATYKHKFSLSQDQGVQYYAEWIADEQSHNVTIKWFDAQGKLISQLVLTNFSQHIVRDYISFSQQSKTQFFIPQQLGWYEIYLYIDSQLRAVTKFKVIK